MHACGDGEEGEGHAMTIMNTAINSTNGCDVPCQREDVRRQSAMDRGTIPGCA